MRHLNRHRDPPCLACDRHQPVTECREACTAMCERPLAHNRAGLIEQAGLVLCRAPVDAGEPAECLVSRPGSGPPKTGRPLPSAADHSAGCFCRHRRNEFRDRFVATETLYRAASSTLTVAICIYIRIVVRWI